MVPWTEHWEIHSFMWNVKRNTTIQPIRSWTVWQSCWRKDLVSWFQRRYNGISCSIRTAMPTRHRSACRHTPALPFSASTDFTRTKKPSSRSLTSSQLDYQRNRTVAKRIPLIQGIGSDNLFVQNCRLCSKRVLNERSNVHNTYLRYCNRLL